MKIEVNWDRCEANALCMRAAPAVFLVDDADKMHVLCDDVPEEQKENVRRAAARCPKRALTLVGE